MRTSIKKGFKRDYTVTYNLLWDHGRILRGIMRKEPTFRKDIRGDQSEFFGHNKNYDRGGSPETV